MNRFLMVITKVDEEGTVTLMSIDEDVPTEMKWFYGDDTNVEDRVGETYEISLEKLTKANR